MPIATYSDQLDVVYTVSSSELLKMASDSEAWAAGTREGVDVDIDDDTYHNNAKYYSQQAATAVVAQTLLGIVDKAAYHNGIFRGKSLGTEFTAGQQTAISSGEFDDLYIGDYWTIDGIKYYIADFMYWYGKGPADDRVSSNHICVVSQILGAAPMSSTADTGDGYIGTDLYAGLSEYSDIVNTAFGGAAVLPRSSLLPSAFSNGSVSYTNWAPDIYVDIMTQPMVFGSHVIGNGYPSIDSVQLSLFRLANRMTGDILASNTETNGFWFRDPVTDSDFAYFTPDGYADRCEATATRGVAVTFALS